MTAILSALSILAGNSLWMAWNIFLGGIPLVLGRKLFCQKHSYSALWFIGFVLYILFLPNAPYIFTDIIHLHEYGGIRSEFITGVIAIQFILFLTIGYFLFVESYHYFEQFVTKLVTINTTLVRLASFIVISIGVYMGRVLRLNSWDIFTSPLQVATKTIVHLNTVQALSFVALFTALMLSIVTIRDRIKAEALLQR